MWPPARGCSAVQAQEQLVRSALTAMFAPELDEALMDRLRAIPDLYPDAQARPATAEPLDLSAEPWPRRSARRLGRWLAALRPRSPAGKVAARTPRRSRCRGSPGILPPPALPPGPPPVGRRRHLRRPGRRLPRRLRGGAPLLGHATVTPTPSPVAPPAPAGTPAADAVLPPGATPTADPWTDAYPDPADPPGPFPNAVWEYAAPAGIAAGSGDSVADFCVLPDDGLVLFILRRGKEGSADAQLAARDDQRVLLLPAHALRPRAAPVEPRVFADLGDLPGSAEAQLTALDCATQAGRVLVMRQNAWRSARDTAWQGDLWLLDGSGTRLNAVSLLGRPGRDARRRRPGARRPGGPGAGRTGGWRTRAAPGRPVPGVRRRSTSVVRRGGRGHRRRPEPAQRQRGRDHGLEPRGPLLPPGRHPGLRHRHRRLPLGRAAGRARPSAPAYIPDPAGSGASNPAPTADPRRRPARQRRGRLDPATLQLTDDGSLTWLQWLDDEAAVAPLADVCWGRPRARRPARRAYPLAVGAAGPAPG